MTLWQGVHSFACPTRVLYGRGAAAQLPGELDALKVRRPLVVSDHGVTAAGIVDHVLSKLPEAQRPSIPIFTDVRPNPTTENVSKALSAWRAHRCDGIVGVGGGSSLDVAKGLGILASNDGRIADYSGLERVPRDLPPVICLPTTCGTGSEVTYNAVISDVAEHRKLGFVSRKLAPKVALVDPELVDPAPPNVIAATGADALAHAVESYLNLARDPLIDALCIAAIRLIGTHLPRAVQDHDRKAVDAMALAATMAGLAFNQNANAIVHAASTPVTARFDVAHGVANALFMPEGLRFCAPACPERLAEIGTALGGKPTPEGGVQAVRELLCSVGLPSHLRELGIDADRYEQSIPTMVRDAMLSRSIPLNPRVVTHADLAQLYRAVFG